MALAVNRGLAPHIPFPKPGCLVDRTFVVRRLLRNAVTLLAAHPRAEYLGPDTTVENLARSRDFKTYDLAILRISLGQQRYTLICVPEPVWQDRMAELLDLKRMASWAGRSCVLIPERAIQRQPRLDTARALEQATGVEVTMEHRMAVLLHLVERGSSTLMDCACAIAHPAPFSAILHLAALGVVKMDTIRALSPDTRIDPPDRVELQA